MFLASIWFPPNAVIGIGTDCAVSSLFLAVTTTSSKTDVSSSAAIENEGNDKKESISKFLNDIIFSPYYVYLNYSRGKK